MKRIKLSICLAFFAVMSYIYAPNSTAVTINSTSTGTSTGTSINTAYQRHAGIDLNTIDDKMLLSPRYNCDPKMLIPGNPDIDPKMLLKALP